MEAGLNCPLCNGSEPSFYARDKRRGYWQCAGCRLVFVAERHRLDPSAEKARYDLHRNDPGDPRYVAFLSRLMNPMLERLPEGSRGLDFGSGPGPALAAMLNERGRPTACYDPYYATDEDVWARTYDFITASEVIEHLHHPARELDRLFGVLRRDGWLGIMTRLLPQLEDFMTWHYRRDDTHVCFYSRETFDYIADRWRAALTPVEPDVVLLQKL
jgi:hypothetical protein